MSRSNNDSSVSRVEELLVDRATQGLTEEEARELDFLGATEDDSFDLAAAAADLATLDIQPMPAVIAGRVLATVGPPPAKAVAEPRARDTQLVIPIDTLRKRSRRTQMFAWIAAAACLLLAVGTILWASQRDARVEYVKVYDKDPKITPIEQTVAEQRARLLATAKDATTLAWTATEDPNGKGTAGDVLWSASQQQGYMRFVGLAPNDRAQIQYQLWIFDETRDAAFPVDGGVFDVGASGEVIIPIAPKLHVNKVSLFAVTVEKPGGVVVSKRERIVVTAKPA